MYILAKSSLYRIVWSGRTPSEDNMVDITFITHSKANEPRAGQTDKERQLSVMGSMLARQRRLTLSGQNYQMVIHSPALYAKQTAHILAGDPDGRNKTIEVAELAVDEKDPFFPDIVIARRALGPALFREYQKSVATNKALVELGRRGNYALKSVIGAVPNPEDQGHVLIVGHDILLLSISLEMCYRSEDREEIANSLLRHCEGFHLGVNHENETRLIRKI